MKAAQSIILLIFGADVVVGAFLVNRDVSAIGRDLSFASANLTALDTALHGFLQGGGSVVQALTIHTDSTSSLSAIDTAISDTSTAGIITSTDASNIESATADMQTTVVDICETFSQNLSVIGSKAGLNIKSLLQQDISNIVSAFASLLTILKDSTPAPQSDDIESLQLQFVNTCNPSTGPITPGSL